MGLFLSQSSRTASVSFVHHDETTGKGVICRDTEALKVAYSKVVANAKRDADWSVGVVRIIVIIAIIVGIVGRIRDALVGVGVVEELEEVVLVKINVDD